MQYSIVRYSELERTSRLDSEYFNPEFLYLNDVLSNKKMMSLITLSEISDGNHMSVASYFQDNTGIPYYRGKDINTDFFLENAKPIFIPEAVYNFPYMKRSWFQECDILLSIVGTIGSISLVTSKIKKSTGSCKIAIIRPKQKESSNYIATFLKSKYGQFQIKRNTRGAVQQGLLLEDMDQIKVYIPKRDFKQYVSRLVEESIKKNRLSKSIFKDAKNTLLSELGLTSWQPKHQLTFIKNYSDTEQAGRIDAEYYQPKYDDIISAIKNYSGGWDTLDNLVTLKNKNFKPKDKEQYQYIELANIAGNGEITDCMLEEGQDLPTRARRKVATGDVIVSSIEGSLSSIALIEKEYNLALCSTGFHVVNSKQFNSETLLVLLKSIAGQLQLKKGCSGTILTAINKEEFKSIILPKVAEVKQQEIRQKVTESFNLRKQSKHLLECAKEAVEMAIEQDEQKAINWLKEQTRNIGAGDADRL